MPNITVLQGGCEKVTKMRIAFLSIHSSPLGRAGEKDTGGMSTFLRGLSSALGEAGHKVDLFTRPDSAGKDLVREIKAGVRLVCPDDGLGPLSKQELYPHYRTIAESIDRFCRGDNSRYDLIFSHYWLSGCVGQVLKKNWNVPHMLMFHTLGRAKNEACPEENEPLLRLEAEKELARSCDLIITAARQEKEKILTYFDLPLEKVALIPCGINREIFKALGIHQRLRAKEQLGWEKKTKIILSVGRIEPVKGLDLLLKAASLLPAEESFQVVIAGGDKSSSIQVESYKKTAARLGLEGKVYFTGIVEHEKLPFYYNAADVTVLTSHYESFGLVALESIACGTPVVASPVGIIPELIATGNNDDFIGYMVENRNPPTWAEKISRALNSNKPLDQSVLDTRLAPYSWKQAASELITVINSL